MSGTFILLVGLILGSLISGVTFVFNSGTPLQLGPIPFFGGVILAAVSVIGLIARFASRL